MTLKIVSNVKLFGAKRGKLATFLNECKVMRRAVLHHDQITKFFQRSRLLINLSDSDNFDFSYWTYTN